MKTLRRLTHLVMSPLLATSWAFAAESPTAARDGSTDAAALPVAVAATDPQVRYVGRFDFRDQAGPRCAWSASSIALKFQGTGANVKLRDNGQNRWQIEIDDQPTAALALQNGEHTYAVASGLAPGAHTVRLVRATEAHFGPTQVTGFQLAEGAKLLPLTPPTRRLEVIGDSISCGYGNEAASQNEHFSPATENAYRTYGAIAARTLGADYVCVAWSGKKMWPDNTIPELYDRTLPFDPGSKWDFAQWTPNAVLINLSTNDFGRGAPDEAGWIAGYKAFLARLRTVYPKAEIYCATSPMMSDWSPAKLLSVARRYLTTVVTDLNNAGDKKVHLIEFAPQQMSDGLGADWHPNVKTNEIMAEKLVSTLRQDLGW